MTDYHWTQRVVDWLELSEAERDVLFSEMPEDGRLVVLNLPNKLYHGGPGISFSSLKRRLKSAWSFKHGGGEEESDAMRLGTLAHTALLEPDKLNEELFALLPQDEKGKDMVRNERHKAYQEFLAKAGERTIVRRRDWEEAQELARSVRAHEFVNSIFTDPETKQLAEVSLYWRDPETGLLLRCRPDNLSIPNAEEFSLICWDLKTVKNAAYSAIQYEGERWRHYPLGAAHYCEGVRQVFQRKVTYCLIAAEKTEEREVLLYCYARPGGDLPIAQIGQTQHRRVLAQVAESYESNTWPRQHEGVREMEPSRFFLADNPIEADPEPF